MHSAVMRKVTLSLPAELLEFADTKAAEKRTNRSAAIAGILEDQRQRELEALGREGYLFYAAEAEEFAQASAPALAEVLAHDRSAW